MSEHRMLGLNANPPTTFHKLGDAQPPRPEESLPANRNGGLLTLVVNKSRIR